MKLPTRNKLIALLAVLTITGAACGSTSTSEESQDQQGSELPTLEQTIDGQVGDAVSDSSGQKPPIEVEEAFDRYSECMAEFGVPVSLSGGGGAALPEDPDDTGLEPITPEKMAEAQAQCEPILDDAFGGFDASPEQKAEQADTMLFMERCMQDQGIEVDIQGNRMGFKPGVDMSKVSAAMEHCQAEADQARNGDDR